jgi:hypothetical protein
MNKRLSLVTAAPLSAVCHVPTLARGRRPAPHTVGAPKPPEPRSGCPSPATPPGGLPPQREAASAAGFVRPLTAIRQWRIPPSTEPDRCRLRAVATRRDARRHRTRGGRQNGLAPAGDAAGSPRRGRRQPFAAFLPPGFQDLPAARRRHARAKAMRLAPVAFLGLVGPFDDESPGGWNRVGSSRKQRTPTEIPREYSVPIVVPTLRC